jgi:hypothetical protein
MYAWSIGGRGCRKNRIQSEQLEPGEFRDSRGSSSPRSRDTKAETLGAGAGLRGEPRPSAEPLALECVYKKNENEL